MSTCKTSTCSITMNYRSLNTVLIFGLIFPHMNLVSNNGQSTTLKSQQQKKQAAKAVKSSSRYLQRRTMLQPHIAHWGMGVKMLSSNGKNIRCSTFYLGVRIFHLLVYAYIYIYIYVHTCYKVNYVFAEHFGDKQIIYYQNVFSYSGWAVL